jgi:transposase-like protein
LSAWLEDNLPDGFTVFDFPLEHRRHIRTTNSLERVNKEIRRRTGVVGIFPNEASCLRLNSALLMEVRSGGRAVSDSALPNRPNVKELWLLLT